MCQIESGIDAWPPLRDTLDIHILGGEPAQSGRVGFGSLEDPIVGSVWEYTPGCFELNYTVREIATILDRKVNITDPDANTETCGPVILFTSPKARKLCRS